MNGPFDSKLNAENYCEELDITNPYGKISCLVLYLYSMELGVPPLYSEINRVSREMDMKFLQMLGPFIKALGIVTASSERNREEIDQITPGETFGGLENNLSGIFLLFRGAQAQGKCIEDYKKVCYVPNSECQPMKVKLPGSSSCS